MTFGPPKLNIADDRQHPKKKNSSTPHTYVRKSAVPEVTDRAENIRANEPTCTLVTNSSPSPHHNSSGDTPPNE